MKFSDIVELLNELRKSWEIYIVGGSVRDWILKGYEDFRVKDCDFVLIGTIKDLRSLSDTLQGKGFKVKKFSQFGTAELEFKGVNFDIAIARREYYEYPGALPKVEFVRDLSVDVKRRDFTVNALYYDGKSIIDFVKGIEDLKNRTLKPLASFSDDPTRIFRGVRYKNVLKFNYSNEFFDFMAEGKRYIQNVSPQRLLNELRITSQLNAKSLTGFFKELIKFSLLEWAVEEIPLYKTPRFLGKPTSSRWIIFLAPFIKRSLPLNSLEKKCVEVLKIGHIKEDLEGIHKVFHNRSDIEVLTYANWKSENIRIFVEYLKLRKKIQIKLYPIEERIKSFKKSAENLNIETPLPEIIFEDPPSQDRGSLKLALETFLMNLWYNHNR